IVQATLAGAFPGQLLAAEGFRPAGTFYGANMCADYLVLAMFVALSLWGRTSRLLLLASGGLLLVGLLTTKSNGSLISLVVGGGATALLWSMRAEGSRTRRAGTLALFAAVAVLGWWAVSEMGLGAALGRGVGQGTMLGRMEKSSAGRQEIWGQLGTQLARHPLGIGPGNSVLQSVAIGHRVRPGTSFQSKEAHSDYMAFAIERGPIGLLGHLLWVLAGIGLVLRGDGAVAPTALLADRGTFRDPARRASLLRAIFVGGLIASAVHSVVIEKLHFRHYWMFLALSCAVTAGAKFRSPSSSPAPVLRPAVARAGGAR
ncbi:MAG: O-antigen ligase family protein, partial [Candidatus Eisenbacteria bacterium]